MSEFNRLLDRCDACGAQAFVKVINHLDLELLFCGHHYAKSADELERQAFLVDVDERSFINERPSVSANVE